MKRAHFREPPAPLWQRALLARAKARRPKDKKRKHPKAKVGDRFGHRTIIAILPRDRTSNERVLTRCRCGREAPAYVFNLRRVKACWACGRVGRPRSAA